MKQTPTLTKMCMQLCTVNYSIKPIALIDFEKHLIDRLSSQKVNTLPTDSTNKNK
jgi:hypothetical protein